MDKMTKQQELQGIVGEIENYKRRMEELSRQGQLIENTALELNSTIEALNALAENKPGTTILVPLGSGSFARAELKDTEKVIVGIGSNISVEKNTADAKKVIEARVEELNSTFEKIQKTAIGVNNKLIELSAESERLIRAIRGGQQ